MGFVATYGCDGYGFCGFFFSFFFFFSPGGGDSGGW